MKGVSAATGVAEVLASLVERPLHNHSPRSRELLHALVSALIASYEQRSSSNDEIVRVLHSKAEAFASQDGLRAALALATAAFAQQPQLRELFAFFARIIQRTLAIGPGAMSQALRKDADSPFVAEEWLGVQAQGERRTVTMELLARFQPIVAAVLQGTITEELAPPSPSDAESSSASPINSDVTEETIKRLVSALSDPKEPDEAREAAFMHITRLAVNADALGQVHRLGGTEKALAFAIDQSVNPAIRQRAVELLSVLSSKSHGLWIRRDVEKLVATSAALWREQTREGLSVPPAQLARAAVPTLEFLANAPALAGRSAVPDDVIPLLEAVPSMLAHGGATATVAMCVVFAVRNALLRASARVDAGTQRDSLVCPLARTCAALIEQPSSDGTDPVLVYMLESLREYTARGSESWEKTGLSRDLVVLSIEQRTQLPSAAAGAVALSAAELLAVLSDPGARALASIVTLLDFREDGKLLKEQRVPWSACGILSRLSKGEAVAKELARSDQCIEAVARLDRACAAAGAPEGVGIRAACARISAAVRQAQLPSA